MTVLAFTRSKLLEVYFFRMWLSLIVSGALHGLVLLPVLLSLFGGRGYEFEEADEEWMLKVCRFFSFLSVQLTQLECGISSSCCWLGGERGYGVRVSD